MKWPFQKKAPESRAGEEAWQILQGEHEGRPMLVRMNTSARREGAPRLQTRLGIAIPFRSPDERGFPQGAELRELEVIEERIFAAILESRGCVVLVITTGGMREFISYVPSQGIGDAVAAKVRASTATHEIQHYTEADANWSLLDQFASRG